MRPRARSAGPLLAAAPLAGRAATVRTPAAAQDASGADEVRRGIMTGAATASRGDVEGLPSVFSHDVLPGYYTKRAGP